MAKIYQMHNSNRRTNNDKPILKPGKILNHKHNSMNTFTFTKPEKEVIVKDLNGIQFYTRKKDGEAGMSLSSLPICCDTSRGTILRIVGILEDRSPTILKIRERINIKWLETDTSKTENQAKVLHYTTCAQIISYFAETGSIRAKEVLAKFSQFGTKEFINEMSGYNTYIKEQEQLALREQLKQEIFTEHHANSERLLNRLLNNFEQIIDSHKNLVQHQVTLLEQNNELMAEHQQMSQEIFSLLSSQQEILQLQSEGTEENLSLPPELEAQKRRSQMRLVSTPSTRKKREAVLFFPKKNYNVETDLIPLQYLAETFKLELYDTRLSLGRNRFYEILRLEGVMWPHNCEIDRDFFERGYFTINTVTMPSDRIRTIQFCTPRGWQWLNQKLRTDWKKYFV